VKPLEVKNKGTEHRKNRAGQVHIFVSKNSPLLQEAERQKQPARTQKGALHDLEHAKVKERE
jgi:hypothetical protein